MTKPLSSQPVAAAIPLPLPPARIAGRLAHSGEELRIVRPARPARPVAAVPPPAENAPVELPNPASNVSALLEAVLEGLEQFASQRASALRELQTLAVTLSVHMARTILNHEFTLSTERVRQLAARAVEQLESATPPVISVCPADLGLIAQSGTGSDGPLAAVRWRSDPALKPGDVRIEGGNYGLESRVGEQLDQIANNLLENLADAATERRRAAGDGQPLGRFPDRRHSS